MPNISSPATGSAGPEGFYANEGLLTPEDRELAGSLIAENQRHLFSGWDKPGINDDKKREFLSVLLSAHQSYPGGLPGYIKNARVLLAEAAAARNPYDGCTPEQPDIVDLSGFGDEYFQAEAAGRAAFAQTAVVLVAGGLGERTRTRGRSPRSPRTKISVSKTGRSRSSARSLSRRSRTSMDISLSKKPTGSS